MKMSRTFFIFAFASFLGFGVFSVGCSENILKAKDETVEAVDNLKNEATEIKEGVEEKIDQVNEAKEDVADAVEAVNEAANSLKEITRKPRGGRAKGERNSI